MEIKMIAADWESLIVLFRAFKADDMTLSQVVHLENVNELIQSQLKDYLKEKGELLAKAQIMIDAAKITMDKLRAKYIGQPDHPEILQFTNGFNAELDKDVNGRLEKLQMAEKDIEIQDNWIESLQKIYVRQAFFGDGGYHNNHLGRAAYVRTLKALGIPTEAVEEIDKERTKEVK